MAELNLAIMAGKETKQFMLDLLSAISRVEKILAKVPALERLMEEDEDEDEENEIEEKPKRSKKAKAPVVDEDEDDNDEDADAGNDNEEDDDGGDDSDVETDSDDEDDSEDSDDGEESVDDEDEEEDEKPKKGPKITVDMCNDAAKEAAAATNRTNVLAIMKKKFKTKTVSSLDPKQYVEFIKVMKKETKKGKAE